MIRTAIVEDDQLYQKKLSSYITQYGEEHGDQFLHTEEGHVQI